MATPTLTYAFQPNEETREGFARILGEIAAQANELARHSSGPMEESIHKGRLLIKRLRALLWFARPVLDKPAYPQVKTELRNAAGLLGGHRDLAVAQTTLKKLEKKTSKLSVREAVTQTLRKMALEKEMGEEADEKLRQSLAEAMGIVARSVAALKKNATSSDSWPSPRERLAKAAHAQIKAEKKARRSGDDADFHEWRKKAKRLLYELELTRPAPGKKIPKAMKSVEKLQEKLGEYHDNIMVETLLREHALRSSSARCVLKSLDRQKTHLRKRAGKIARQVKAKL
jgi:CHAD domain-containing protein